MNDEVYLKMSEVTEMVGINRMTVAKLMKAGLFPKSFTMGGWQRWVKSEIDEWIKEQIENNRYAPK